MSNLVLRNMCRADLNHAFTWSVQEGWNIGRYDHDVFFATDPNGFFMAELDGEPIGCISAVRYEEHFGFIGIFILRPAFRGRGFGIKLFRHAMEYLKGRNIGLDGVLEQQANYSKSGFNLAHRNTRFRGTGGGSVPAACVPLSTISFDQITAFDRQHHFAARPEFLSRWYQQPHSTALAVSLGERLVGCGMIRQYIEGWSIAPLFAETVQVADTLLQGLMAQHPGSAVYIDVPMANEHAVELVTRHGFAYAFESARMYTGAFPNMPIDQIYGITSLELG